MPPRKEPKQTVVYPASKRKAPPFKPQRPSQVMRLSAPDLENVESRQASINSTISGREDCTTSNDGFKDNEEVSEEVEEEGQTATRKRSAAANTESDSSDSLASDAAIQRPPARRPLKTTSAPRQTRPTTAQPASSPPLPDPDPDPLDGLESVVIPQPLLLRLLHERFSDKATKIDKLAIQALQKYLEVFVREAMARSAARKKELVEKGEVEKDEECWLELEDLERVCAGMMLDF